MPPTHDVVFIGAGLASLTAARSLNGHRIAILEARNRAGGRAFTSSETPEAVDLGCSMIHGFKEGNPAAKLITRELSMDVHIPEGAKGLVYGANGVLSEADASSLFATSAQNAFNPSPTTPVDASIASLLFPNLKNDPRLVALARTAEIGAGATLEEQAAKYAGFEQGCKGADAWPVGGYGAEVVRNLLADVKASGGEVHLDSEVVSVEDLGAQEGVKVTTKGGKEFTAKVVISTIPHAVLREAPPNFSPPLPAQFTSAIERMRTGALEKIVLSYPSAWWPSPSETGSFLLLPLTDSPFSSSSSSDKPSSLSDLFSRIVIPVISFQRLASTPHPTLLAYIGADAARVLSTFPDSEVTSAFHSYLVSRLSLSSPPPEPSVALVTSWLRDPFSRGATSTPVVLSSSSDGEPNTPLDFILVARPTWEGRLGWAGEHTVLDNHGSVAGAVESGRREGERVKELLERLAEA
ncbi:hypothetical protein JCM8547_002224 [Rhodosporidiobolus lusitaniae]